MSDLISKKKLFPLEMHTLTFPEYTEVLRMRNTTFHCLKKKVEKKNNERKQINKKTSATCIILVICREMERVERKYFAI